MITVIKHLTIIKTPFIITHDHSVQHYKLAGENMVSFQYIS